jgi:hypothetical protein
MVFESIQTSAGLLFCGGIGALVKEITHDNTLQLPKVYSGKLFLGVLGSVIIGGVIGLIVDHSFVTAFLAGYTGFSAIAYLLPNAKGTPNTDPEIITPPEMTAITTVVLPPDVAPLTIPEIIKRAADKFGVDYNLALAVAKCESSLNPKARLVNKTGSIDRGLYQINNYWHKDVSDTQADDPTFAAEWFCEAVKDGHLSWWNASKPCWGVALKA